MHAHHFTSMYMIYSSYALAMSNSDSVGCHKQKMSTMFIKMVPSCMWNTRTKIAFAIHSNK